MAKGPTKSCVKGRKPILVSVRKIRPTNPPTHVRSVREAEYSPILLVKAADKYFYIVDGNQRFFNNISLSPRFLEAWILKEDDRQKVYGNPLPKYVKQWKEGRINLKTLTIMAKAAYMKQGFPISRSSEYVNRVAEFITRSVKFITTPVKFIASPSYDSRSVLGELREVFPNRDELIEDLCTLTSADFAKLRNYDRYIPYYISVLLKCLPKSAHETICSFWIRNMKNDPHLVLDILRYILRSTQFEEVLSESMRYRILVGAIPVLISPDSRHIRDELRRELHEELRHREEDETPAARDRMEFIIELIMELGKGKESIHSVNSGFNRSFQGNFPGENPQTWTKKMAQKGIIITSV